MARQHLCSDHPDGKAWYEGTVNQCSYHGQKNRKQIVFKSRQQKRRLDSAAGVQGTQRGGYISGADSGR